ncbi:RDD family protein [Stenotrophomonas sp. MH1]|uniref:RDD family protein n=1 Tax=Stenotrophomonas capsici TaxID=3110230 RepID=A0ABU5V548_9GAMM|nr:RDD family protein [Stenotrophomonas sp. MH1]MEA5668307.1 RDD family protein [Stenotrophomonas sp. MH1]
MSEWYYADAQRERHGPIDADVIRSKFNQGELNLETLAWREGMAQWQPLSALADELQLLAQASPGIDLRADYSAIENGTAPLPAAATTSTDGYSPYSAPSSTVSGGAAPVQGGEVVYAGFWKRVAAYCIDSVIVGMVGGVIAMVIGMVLGIGMAGLGDSDAAGVGMIMVQLLTNLISMAISAAYYAGFHASAGMATLGKMAVGIKVVRLNGDRMTLARAIGRYFATILSALTLCIGYVMAAFTERKQGLHDMICDTLVVDKWAFTDHPEWQQRGLGTVTIVILSIFGLLLLVGVVAIIAVIGIAASNFN